MLPVTEGFLRSNSITQPDGLVVEIRAPVLGGMKQRNRPHSIDDCPGCIGLLVDECEMPIERCDGEAYPVVGNLSRSIFTRIRAPVPYDKALKPNSASLRAIAMPTVIKFNIYLDGRDVRCVSTTIYSGR